VKSRLTSSTSLGEELASSIAAIEGIKAIATGPVIISGLDIGSSGDSNIFARLMRGRTWSSGATEARAEASEVVYDRLPWLPEHVPVVAQILRTTTTNTSTTTITTTTTTSETTTSTTRSTTTTTSTSETTTKTTTSTTATSTSTTITTTITTMAEKTYCGPAEKDVLYLMPEVYTIPHVQSANECCKKCLTFPEHRCMVWTWGRHCKDCGLACVLRGSPNFNSTLTKRPMDGVVSGMYKAGHEVVLYHEKRTGPVSLYCYSLMLPFGYERGMLRMQEERNLSIFACEEPAVLSNVSMEVTPKLNTTVVDSDLHCEMGGEFGTALNSWIFIAVWNKVIEVGRFRHHDWTVKVDPDAVWFPGKLRSHLQDHEETVNGVYINNCKYGMHGPIEVFSRNAIEAYARDAKDGPDHAHCVKDQNFGGWGEDMFMDQCLLKVLKVERDNDFFLMCEDHCDCPEWRLCGDDRYVGFHPFKTEEGYINCFLNATSIIEE